VCYVPGLDLRRLPAEHAPRITALLREFPSTKIRTLPDTELLPTILTGMYPHDHGVWQVKLRSAEEAADGPIDRAFSHLPDGLTTTLQGIHHALTGATDLATIPPRRRGRLTLHRFKYERRQRGWVEPDQEIPSVFSMLGPERSCYEFCRHFSKLKRAAASLVRPQMELEFFELYAFDLLQHWNLDRPQIMGQALRQVDETVGELYERCDRSGLRFLLLSDHGQEPVVGAIDLMAAIRDAGVVEDEIDYYIQVPSARFWFHTERAREAVTRLAQELPNASVLGYRDLDQFGLQFETVAYGELYLFADPGYVFFPHDFYHPLANLYLGATDPQQRPRIQNPVHRGCHGYLPANESEIGFILLSDSAFESRAAWVDLIDIAPTILRLTEHEIPARMSGSPIFQRTRSAGTGE
jgi:predicted AlkP superfamily pyrophosphatase or phosphodiesterase